MHQPQQHNKKNVFAGTRSVQNVSGIFVATHRLYVKDGLNHYDVTHSGSFLPFRHKRLMRYCWVGEVGTQVCESDNSGMKQRRSFKMIP